MSSAAVRRALTRLEKRLGGHGRTASESAIARVQDAPKWWLLLMRSAVFGRSLLTIDPETMSPPGWHSRKRPRSEFSRDFVLCDPEDARLTWPNKDPYDFGVHRGYHRTGLIDGGNWITYVRDASDLHVVFIDHESVWEEDEWTFKIKDSKLDLPGLLDGLQLKSSCMFRHPTEDYGRYSQVEIVGGTSVLHDQDCEFSDADRGLTEFATEEEAFEFYVSFCRGQIKRGWRASDYPWHYRYELGLARRRK